MTELQRYEYQAKTNLKEHNEMVDKINELVDAVNSGSGGGGSGYTLPPATKNSLGGVIVGDNLTVDGNGKINAPAPTPAYELPTATGNRLGGVKVGANLTITDDGTLSATGGGGSGYTLPPATGTTLGGVKIGSGVNVESDGTISVSGAEPYTLPVASDTVLGGVKVAEDSGCHMEGETLYIDSEKAYAGIASGTSSVNAVITDADNGVLAVLEYTGSPVLVSYTHDASTGYRWVFRSGDGENFTMKYITFPANVGNESARTIIVSGGGSGYQLPIASAGTLGGVKIGSGITISSDGTISASGGGGSSGPKYSYARPIFKVPDMSTGVSVSGITLAKSSLKSLGSGTNFQLVQKAGLHGIYPCYASSTAIEGVYTSQMSQETATALNTYVQAHKQEIIDYLKEYFEISEWTSGVLQVRIRCYACGFTSKDSFIISATSGVQYSFTWNLTNGATLETMDFTNYDNVHHNSGTPTELPNLYLQFAMSSINDNRV